MSLTFLVPAFLAGLLALAIPIAIHLTRKQTRQSLSFPSLMFLRRLPHRSTRRRQIQRWPLLLLRSLALALLVLAFARPFVQRDGGNALLPAGAQREVVVMLDRSYSMAHGDRWEEASAAAVRVFEGLTNHDRGTLLLFDSGAESVAESTPDAAVLRAAVNRASPGERGTRYTPALRYAQRVLGGSSLPRREVVVISDFQRHAWDAESLEIGAIRLPAGTVVTPVAVGAASAANLAVTGVELQRTRAAGRDRAGIVARVLGGAPRAGEAVPAVLEIDGRTVERGTAMLDASGAGRVEFAPITLPETGSMRATVRISADELPTDDAFRFVVAADQRIPVLIIQGPAGRGSAYFLERALGIGEEPGFVAEVRQSRELRAADLSGRAVIVFAGAPLPGGDSGRRLRQHLQDGGGVVLALGDSPAGELAGILPGSGGTVVDRLGSGGTTLGYLDTGHPVFSAFGAPRSGDFTAARIFRYRSLPRDSETAVLARFGDGGTALAERRVGRGRVLVWPSSFDPDWNDLALQPVFLPFVHQLVKHAAGYSPARPWLTLGDAFDPAASIRSAERFTVAVTPAGTERGIDAATPLELEETGFYELREARSGARGPILAVNVDPAESELEPFDPAEIVSALAIASGASGAAGFQELTREDRERQQSAWWYLIAAVFLLLIGETLLSNRGFATRQAPEGDAAPRADRAGRRFGERRNPERAPAPGTAFKDSVNAETRFLALWRTPELISEIGAAARAASPR